MSSAEEFGVPRDPLIGQIVQERYKVTHAIGRGAMGVVYEAQHLLINRKVALKAMASHSVSPAGVQRFRREAQAAAAVGNSHVVDVLDMGRLESGSFYIVMEHLSGVDLGFAVALDQRFSIGRAIHVLGQLCDALSAIHAAGIVHRDLKPENIFLTTRDGAADFVKVLDFGVCKFDDSEGGRLTATGDAVGTPLFMAPEQVEGRSDCDYRVDIYALGALLYFVLTGQAPFDAPSLPALFMRICHEPAPSLGGGGLSVGLDAIIQRALSKDPNARFSSCGAFKAALRALQATPDEVARTLPGAVYDSRLTEYSWGNVRDNGTVSLVPPSRGRRRRWFGIGVVAVVGVAALAVSASSGAYLEREHGVQPSASPTPVSVRVSPSPAQAAPAQSAPALAQSAHGPQSVPKSKPLRAAPLPQQVPNEPLAQAPLPAVTASPEPSASPAATPPSVTPEHAATIRAAPADSDVHLTRNLKHGL